MSMTTALILCHAILALAAALAIRDYRAGRRRELAMRVWQLRRQGRHEYTRYFRLRCMGFTMSEIQRAERDCQ